MITLRSWFGFYEAVAREEGRVVEVLACALGMPHFCGRYGFGTEVGRA